MLIPTLIIVLTVSGLTGFAFARYNFPGKNAIFLAMLLLIMLPGILLVIPMFVQMVDLGWTNTIQIDGAALGCRADSLWHVPDAYLFRNAAA